LSGFGKDVHEAVDDSDNGYDGFVAIRSFITASCGLILSPLISDVPTAFFTGKSIHFFTERESNHSNTAAMGRLQKSFGHLTEQVVSKDDISLPLDGWSLSSLGCASFVAILFLEVITSDSSSLLQHLRTTLILSAAAGLGLSYGLIRRGKASRLRDVASYH